MTTPRDLLNALAAVVMTASSLSAQTTVSGVVRDPDQRRPFAGATVELVPAATPWASGFRAQADSSGRFTVDSVPAGRYLVGFFHPDLEALGLSQVTRDIAISATQRRLTVDLETPSADSLGTLLCGAREAGFTGVLLGRVRDASSSAVASSGRVQVRWSLLTIGTSGLRADSAAREVPLLPDGRFLVCALPTDAALVVQAEATVTSGMPALRSGAVTLEFAYGSPLLHRDLYVAAATVTRSGAGPAGATMAQLTGRIVDDGGMPIANAQITLSENGARTTSDSSGSFSLTNLPAGTRSIEVVAIGRTPQRLAVDLRPDQMTRQTVVLRRVVPTLERVDVRATRDAVGFDRRRRKGAGYFLDAAAIEKSSVQSLSLLLAAAPMLRTNGVDDRTGQPIVTGRGGCQPTYVVDGHRDGGIADGTEPGSRNPTLSINTVRDIGAIEVYANGAEAPVPFSGGTCAVILIWTKAYVP